MMFRRRRVQFAGSGDGREDDEDNELDVLEKVPMSKDGKDDRDDEDEEEDVNWRKRKEDDNEEEEDDDEERLRLTRVHEMLSQELQRACATLGVVEDGANANKETRDIYGRFGASLDTSDGLVTAIAKRKRLRRIGLLISIAFFCGCVLWCIWCRLPIIHALL